MTIDVDKTWDPEKGSLDDHRQAEFAKIQQVPFGQPVPKPVEPTPEPDSDTDAT